MNRPGLFFATVFLFISMDGLATSPDAIQRGAMLFKDYCAGCHTLRYLQKNQFDISPVSMPADDAHRWFGQVPPDLSFIAKTRGTDGLHAYLTSFYPDASRPFGTNNHLMPDLMMPNPLAPLNRHDLNAVVTDLVDFLTYVAEPSKDIRIKIGQGVMLFMFIFLIIIYQLKRLYWRKLGR